MQKKIVSIFPANRRSYLRNGIFHYQKHDAWNPIIVYLKRFLKKHGVEINTYDISPDKPTKYVYFDLPYPLLSNSNIWQKILLNRDKNILICHEPPIVNPLNYMKTLHLFFAKIYTWNDDLVDNKKYFKIHLPQYSLGLKTPIKDFRHKKFLILINSNKLPFFPFKMMCSFGKELYSERIKAIEFFEKRIPNKFFLYGKGWNKRKKYNAREVVFGYKKYLTYKGEVDDKIKLLSNFKFCICFENLTDAKGYVTEKIFDCFKAKCVPVYFGASNIEKYIPNNCFIDFRNFGDYNKLLKHLTSIDEVEYNHYLKNIIKLSYDKKFIDLWFENGFAKFFLEDVLHK